MWHACFVKTKSKNRKARVALQKSQVDGRRRREEEERLTYLTCLARMANSCGPMTRTRTKPAASYGRAARPGPGTQQRTRKMKSQARMVLNMTGGNLSAAADILGIDQNTLVMLLLKRFRNDGPVVTKAALRKTKQTINKAYLTGVLQETLGDNNDKMNENFPLK